MGVKHHDQQPCPCALFGKMMGFEDLILTWEDLYYGCLQFDIPIEALQLDLKRGLCCHSPSPSLALDETLAK